MKAWTLLFALAVLAGPIRADEVDKPKIRKLAEKLAVLPICDTLPLSIDFSSSEGFKLYGEKTESPVLQIERIRKEMKGDDTDAERYVRLGVLYLKTNDKKASDDAFSRAIGMFRRQVQKHPHDMHRLAQLGDALCRIGEIKEGESLLRRAVKEAPNDWHSWIMLGKCLDERADRIIWGDEKVPFHSSDHEAKRPKPFTTKPSAEQIKKMRELWQEARRCYDRAIELAPEEKEPYCRRAGSLYWRGMCEAKLRNIQAKQSNGFVSIFTEDYLADTRQIARFSPNDPASVGGAVLAELMACLEANRKTNERMGWFADPLPHPSRDFVRWGIGRLEELAKGKDKKSAAAASEILALVSLQKMTCEAEMMDRSEEKERRKEAPGSVEKSGAKIKEGLGDISMFLKGMAWQRQMQQHFLRAVQLDPTRESAWAGLMMFCAISGFNEALVECEKLIKTQDNSYVRCFLGFSYVQKQQFDKAANHFRQGIAKDKDDLNCRLGLAAVLLRKDDAEALKEAREQLDFLGPLIKQAKSKARTIRYNLLVGLCAALDNQPEPAKKWLQSILWSDMELKGDLQKVTALEALAALGIPAAPADESLAIAYLQVRKDKIQREDKRPDSPVVKVRLTQNNIGDEDLYFLSAFAHLRDLRLSSVQITDAGLVHLERIPTLRHLYLNSPEITDAGLMHLRKLQELESVDLHGTKVTNKGIAELRKVFPKLDIAR